MLQQCYDYTSDIPLIENNGVTPDWDCNPFWSASIVFNESILLLCHHSIIFSSDAKVLCKWTLTCINN